MPREAAYDTELLQTLTGINRMQVRALVTQFHKFEPLMFAFKLANFLHGRPVKMESAPTASSENRISTEDDDEESRQEFPFF